MEIVRKELKIETSSEKAFRKFVYELDTWWPKEYTWSQEALQDIWIEGKQDGLCTEIGPHGFRCDWGRVTEFLENKRIGLKWQIGPNRVPAPNPEKASDIQISFRKTGDSSTILELAHQNFEKHGNSWEEYLKMMDSKQGWDYMLNSFKTYCEK